MHECLFYKPHASFSPPCEFIKLMHSFFSPPCELIKLMQSFFSPPCELIRLMQSSFHHRANLSGSCTLLLFFTTVRTYQTHTLFFRLLAFRPVSYTCKEHCGFTELCGRNLEILQRRKLCGTETLLGLLVWVRFQIKSIFIIYQYAQHKYYH